MKHIEIETKWGVADFSDKDKEQLQKLLTGTDDFRVFIGVRLYSRSAEIYGKGNDVEIRVESEMDSLDDGALVGDALTDLDLEVADDDEWNDLLEAVFEQDISTVEGVCETIPRNSSVSHILERLSVCETESEAALDSNWEVCKSIVRDFINARRAS